jgi:hypothetical protein
MAKKKRTRKLRNINNGLPKKTRSELLEVANGFKQIEREFREEIDARRKHGDSAPHKAAALDNLAIQYDLN